MIYSQRIIININLRELILNLYELFISNSIYLFNFNSFKLKELIVVFLQNI